MSRKNGQEGRAQGTSMEGRGEGAPGCKVQPTGDYGPLRRGQEGQSCHLKEEGAPATAQCWSWSLKPDKAGLLAVNDKRTEIWTVCLKSLGFSHEDGPDFIKSLRDTNSVFLPTHVLFSAPDRLIIGKVRLIYLLILHLNFSDADTVSPLTHWSDTTLCNSPALSAVPKLLEDALCKHPARHRKNTAVVL